MYSTTCGRAFSSNCLCSKDVFVINLFCLLFLFSCPFSPLLPTSATHTQTYTHTRKQSYQYFHYMIKSQRFSNWVKTSAAKKKTILNLNTNRLKVKGGKIYAILMLTKETWDRYILTLDKINFICKNITMCKEDNLIVISKFIMET